MQKKSYLSKVFIMGAAGVGKTQLSYRLTGLSPFSEDHVETIGQEFLATTVEDSRTSNRLQIWTHGRGTDDASFTYTNATICLMWDPSNEQSFSALSDFIEKIRSADKSIPIIFIQGKADLEFDKTRLAEQKNKIATMMNDKPTILATSAKTDEGVEALKKYLFKVTLQKHQEAENKYVPFYQKNAQSQATKKSKGSCWCCLWGKQKHKILIDEDTPIQGQDFGNL